MPSISTIARRLGLMSSSGNIKQWVTISLVGGIVVLFVILCVLVWYMCCRTRRLGKSVEPSNWQPTYTRFSYGEIVKATNSFDETRVIGRGGFGKVYLGTLDDGTSVAVKEASGLHGQGEKEFRAEIEMLLRLRHHHLISLLGYCEENSKMILVYEYMENGTLRQHLYDIDEPTHQPLTWIQRLKIAIGAAIGLHYLHTGSARPIIHRDIKSTNILLDKNLVAKVSDFGLSKELPAVDDNEFSCPKGSLGYWDPEYYRSLRFNEKSDVYSFGVVLFEILCGRRVFDQTLPGNQVGLAEWALHCCHNNILDQIIDPRIGREILPECFKIYVQTAVSCLATEGKDRPSMGDILVNLQRGLHLQESDGVFPRDATSRF